LVGGSSSECGGFARFRARIDDAERAGGRVVGRDGVDLV
jgi:hypothetical protein